MHSKTRHIYRILNKCILESTLQDCYMYERVPTDGKLWVRPITEFDDLVEVNGDMVKRFTAVAPADYA